jgi:hypothetical protein
MFLSNSSISLWEPQKRTKKYDGREQRSKASFERKQLLGHHDCRFCRLSDFRSIGTSIIYGSGDVCRINQVAVERVSNAAPAPSSQKVQRQVNVRLNAQATDLTPFLSDHNSVCAHDSLCVGTWQDHARLCGAFIWNHVLFFMLHSFKKKGRL